MCTRCLTIQTLIILKRLLCGFEKWRKIQPVAGVFFDCALFPHSLSRVLRLVCTPFAMRFNKPGKLVSSKSATAEVVRPIGAPREERGMKKASSKKTSVLLLLFSYFRGSTEILFFHNIFRKEHLRMPQSRQRVKTKTFCIPNIGIVKIITWTWTIISNCVRTYVDNGHQTHETTALKCIAAAVFNEVSKESSAV